MAPSPPTVPARTLLLYAQDSKGMGHITRTLTIARHLLAACPNGVAYVATESPVTGEFRLPERCDYVKLPAGLAPGEATVLRFRKLRARLLLDTALGLAPDLVLVDHEPLGHKGEFGEGLWALKAERPATKFVFGLRDIMDDVERIRAQWRDLGAYRAFEELYDGIAVYGSRAVYDVAEAYALPDAVRPKLHYCGYIVRELASVDPGALRAAHGLPRNGPLVLATVGSGSDGYPVLEAACAAVERLERTLPDLLAILVTGPFMPAAEQARLRARATARCRVVSRADNVQLMAAADAVVSMGGYNSVCEALALARPLVIVPRVTHKVEQRIRAETLAARGLARWVHPADLAGDGLVEALEWALRQDRQAHAARVRETIPSFDGAAELTAYLSPWLGGD
jgi:predicted glycosyltransferase